MNASKLVPLTMCGPLHGSQLFTHDNMAKHAFTRGLHLSDQ